MPSMNNPRLPGSQRHTMANVSRSQSLAEVFASPVTARLDGSQLVVCLRGWRAIPDMSRGVRAAWYWGHRSVRWHANGHCRRHPA